MTTRTLRLTGLGLAAAVALAASGCAADEEGSPDPTPTAGPASDGTALDLTSSTDALGESSFRFELRMGEELSANGAGDPATGSGLATLTMPGESPDQPMEIEIMFTGSDLWVSPGDLSAVLGVGTEWLLVDLSRLGGGVMGWEPGRSDPANAAAMIAGLEGVTQVDDRTFQGEVDLSQIDGSAFSDDRLLQLSGRQASVVPVTVVLTEAGQLERLAAELPATGDQPARTLEINYFDYGTDVTVTPPADDEVSPAPEMLYPLLAA